MDLFFLSFGCVDVAISTSDVTMARIEELVSDSSSSAQESCHKDEDDEIQETVWERVVALKEIISEKHRDQLAVVSSSIYSAVSSGLRIVGRSAWILSTSFLLIGLPLIMEVEREHMYSQYETEQKTQKAAQQVRS